MTPFDTFVVVDWSARALPSPVRTTKDSIWIAVASRSGVACSYHRTRHAATAWLADLFEAEVTAGRRVVAPRERQVRALGLREGEAGGGAGGSGSQHC